MFHPLRFRPSRPSLPTFLACALLLAFGPAAEAGKAGNKPPVISGSPALNATVGVGYAFQPSAFDPEGKMVSYRISGKPAWATFSTATGRLAGTPTAAGKTGSITISASDGKKAAALPAFSITVAAPVVNRAPTISGAPVTAAQVDRPYAFQPTATDADNDTLTFSISGKPSWATFDSTSGTLYGTPVAGDVGMSSNIMISVTDGKQQVALAPFSINVAPAPTRTVTLNWTAPTMNTDGSALTDLAGYTVFYGNASRQYSTSLRLTGAGTNSVVIEGFASGTWYFTIKSVNNAGVESDYGGEVVAQL